MMTLPLPRTALTVIRIAPTAKAEGSILYCIDMPEIGVNIQLDLRRAEILPKDQEAALEILTQTALDIRKLQIAGVDRIIYGSLFNPAALGHPHIKHGFNRNRGESTYRMTADNFCGSTITCALRTGGIKGEEYGAAMYLLGKAVLDCRNIAVHFSAPEAVAGGQFAPGQVN